VLLPLLPDDGYQARVLLAGMVNSYLIEFAENPPYGKNSPELRRLAQPGAGGATPSSAHSRSVRVCGGGEPE